MSSLLGISQNLLQDQFANEDSVATPEAFRYSGCLSTTHYVRWGEGVQRGEVTIETAAKPDFAGKWQTVGVVTFDGSTDPAPKNEYLNVPGTYGAFRHRITDPIDGGTVTTTIVGA